MAIKITDNRMRTYEEIVAEHKDLYAAIKSHRNAMANASDEELINREESIKAIKHKIDMIEWILKEY